MFIMYTDETNNTPSTNAKFFIYGGLILPIENLGRMHDEIAQIRAETGYRPADILKFDTRA